MRDIDEGRRGGKRLEDGLAATGGDDGALRASVDLALHEDGSATTSSSNDGALGASVDLTLEDRLATTCGRLQLWGKSK